MDERRKPYKPDKKRVDANDWERASGLCICETCGFQYYDHAPVVGYEWLTRLCNGKLVKL